MVKYRFYIDESGDHTYKHLDNSDVRYLGLTGILIERKYYQTYAQPELEALKHRLFKYDPDNPPILVRSLIKHRKQWFYVLQDENLNKQWETELLSYIGELVGHAKVYTVVIDKKQHLKNYPLHTFDPYAYSLHVILNRVRGLLVMEGEQADVVAESRGGVEDKQLTKAYEELRENGSHYGDGEYYCKAFPQNELLIRRKDTNVAGLQIADVMAYGQKVRIILEKKKPFLHPLGQFDAKLNKIVDKMVNNYGSYLLT